MPLRQVNLYSATPEELFERLAWFYATANQVQIYDAEGQGHPLSTLVYLSRHTHPAYGETVPSCIVCHGVLWV